MKKKKDLAGQAADAVCGALDELDEACAATAVTAKELAQAVERVRLAERALAETQARAQAAVQRQMDTLRAARNSLDGLTARVRAEEKGKEDKS